MLSQEQREQAANQLRMAERTTQTIEPITITWPQVDLFDAYQVQLINIGERERTGAKVRGYKVGLTSEAMQRMLGVNEPDYGHLMDDMIFLDGDTTDYHRLCSPKIEVEIAFVNRVELSGPNCTAEAVYAATDHILPVFEIIDSRITDWRIGLIDTIADNASSAGVVMGRSSYRADEFDLKAIEVILERNGQVEERGFGSAVLGDPAIAVAWLVNKLSELGESLPAGSVILPGSCTRAVDVHPADYFRATFEGLGTVEIKFTS